jgi:hypothetical protein
MTLNEPLRIDLDNAHSVGLGDNLCLLSVLTNLPPRVDLHLNNDFEAYDKFIQYKRIFRIPDTQLTITKIPSNGHFNAGGYWPTKLFTEYFRPMSVNVHGKILQTVPKDERNKKCIGIAGFYDKDPTGKNEWPYSRAKPMAYWQQVFAWIKSIGYDIISLDHSYHNLENKIELMTQHCRAIISYEGGMAHLAHMLRLPCIMLDWNLPSPSTPFGQLHCDLVHKTDTVYILRNHNEIFSWGEGQFNSVCDELRAGKTNNRLVNGEYKLSFIGPGCQGNLTITDRNDTVIFKGKSIFNDSKVAELLNQYYFAPTE